MSERGDTRFSWMDLWVILGLLLMGWAVVWLMKAEPEISSGRQELQELREAFNECQKLVKEGAANSGRVHGESEWHLQEALMLENEYLNIAERVQAEVPELEKALDQSGSAKV